MERRNVMLRFTAWGFSAILAAAAIVSVRPSSAQLAPQKDYLSEEEADKIRDADSASLRIKLYIAFADDRLKKFDYELNRTSPERRHGEVLNGLLNGYAGCVDDAADQLALAREKQLNVRDVLKMMKEKEKAFLDILLKYDKDGPQLDIYRDTLEDAIDGTKDALNDIADAEKEMPGPPVRRKP